MNTFYTIGIYFYVLSIRFASLFNAKAKQWLNGRKNNLYRIQEQLKGENDIVWFHCASLGEFEQGRPIIEGYKKKYPEHKILLTFFSPSGYEIRKNYEGADWVFYLPADTPANAKEFIKTVRPLKVIFIKYEFWFNYIQEIKAQCIPLYIVSAIFRKEQVFFKYRWFAAQLQHITHFFVQNEESKQLLESINITDVSVSGDSRFDTVKANAESSKEFSLIATFSNTQKTIVIGSSWPKDEAILIAYIKENPQYNYIIAPHELGYCKSLSINTKGLLYSQATTENINSSNVLIVDSIGILSSIYNYGCIAYIGGGFGAGIHNILEAVTFGLPVVFGPNYSKFAEANDLIALNAAIAINDYLSLNDAIASFESFNSTIAINYINKKSGCTQQVIEQL